MAGRPKKLSMKEAEKKLAKIVKSGASGKIAGYKDGMALVYFSKKGRVIEEIKA